jgi:hypothetical protein
MHFWLCVGIRPVSDETVEMSRRDLELLISGLENLNNRIGKALRGTLKSRVEFES